ncbi:MAG: amidohydrolase family protein [Verrucomicrobiota bacterium]
MNRRTFLKRSALAATTITYGCHRTRSLTSSKTKKTGNEIWVDTHLHCFAGTTDTRFPYHERAPYRPTEPATPEHLLECMHAAGVDYAIVVHPEPYQDDHRYLEHCLAVGKGKLKGVGLFFADRPGSLDKIAPLAERIPLVALRVHAYAPDRLPPFDSPELKRLWTIASDLGLAIQLHFEPKYAARFHPYIQAFPHTKVIIDHLGRPFQGLPEEHANVFQMAKHPNTIIKLSAIPSTRQYPHRDITPTIHRLVQAFGPDRMIYGGGFGADATGETYHAAFETARTYIDHLSPADQSLILGGNAAKLFGFPS